MNKIRLKGVIRNITPSHKIKDVDFSKAEIVVKRADDKEDLISIRFKSLTCPYTDGQEVELLGNVRSYSHKDDNGVNHVEIYVFTYFDIPTESEDDITNIFEIDGRICKIDELRTTKGGKHNTHFIIANNIYSSNAQKLNSYLPCIVWGESAEEISKLNISDKIKIKGELHSREYKKELPNGDLEIRVAHELSISSFEKVAELDI